MIAIIDYGMGNIHSVKKAVESMGASAQVTDKPQDLERAEKIIFPGVGAFGDALVELKQRGLDEAIKKSVRSGKAFLGICLGLQVLFEESAESAGVKGLGLLKGKVKKFPLQKGLKIPHMGWNQIKKVTRSPCLSGRQAGHQVTGVCPLLKNIPDNAYVYFCHSYYPEPKESDVIAASTDYGIDFAAVVWQDNIYGVQFHPEKSQDVGLEILKNFVEQC